MARSPQSRDAEDSLAVRAAWLHYAGGLTQAEVARRLGVAGVKAHRLISRAVEAGWVKPKGRRQTPGRPATWVTTEQFLAHFGLDQLADLPGIDELKAAGLLDQRPVLNPIPSEGEMSEAGEDDAGADAGDEVDDSLPATAGERG